MILSFPDPYWDELIISIGGRYQDRFRFTSQDAAVQEFFGSNLIKVAVDLPKHIDGLIRQLPTGHRYTADEFIERNTLLALYKWFLPLDRVEIIRSNMKIDQGKDLHIVAGITSCRISLPQYFMICPCCADEERHGKNKECYLHRSHHAPGVKICAIHHVWLYPTNVRTTGQRGFVSAERIVGNIPGRPIDVSNPRDRVLLHIALDVQWLLNTIIHPCDFNEIRKRYVQLLVEKGYASYSGHVRSKKLIADFREHYGDALLEELDCDLVGKHSRNWLARITQAGQMQHPLRHLLLIQFLGVTVEEFFTMSIESSPFGRGPWPCLNSICPNYHNLIIPSPYLGHSRRLDRNPVGTFVCPTCGFTYVRIGPDKTPQDAFRGKTVSYGPLWNDLLSSLWNDKTLLKRDIAKRLGVGQDTLMRQAKRLGLLGDAATQTTGKQSVHRSSLIQTIMDHREKWLAILVQHPNTCITDLWQEYPEICRVLDHCDYEWFMSHQPARRSGDTSPIVDWPARDQWLASVAPEIVRRIQAETGKRARRVTLNAIALEINWGEGSLQRDSDHLPNSMSIITPLLETHEDFALRRIIYTTQQYKEQQGSIPTYHQFVKKAGLNPEVRTDKVINAVNHAIAELARLSD